MSKITLLLIFVIMSTSSSVQATNWTEDRMDIVAMYEFQSSPCYQLSRIEEEFNQEEYSDVTDEGTLEELQELLNKYVEKINEYIILNNNVGILYYKSMAYSLKVVAENRFGNPDSEDEEYKNAENESENGAESLNFIHSRCNCNGE